MANSSSNVVIQIIVGVVSTVAATLILAYFGFSENGNPFSGNSAPTQTEAATPDPPKPPETSLEPAKPARTQIQIVYVGGDYPNCMLPITIQIGDQSLIPNGTTVTMKNVQSGVQSYYIEGQINCPTAGSCTAVGEGVIDVQPNQEYSLSWRNTGYATCQIVLSE